MWWQFLKKVCVSGRWRLTHHGKDCGCFTVYINKGDPVITDGECFHTIGADIRDCAAGINIDPIFQLLS